MSQKHFWKYIQKHESVHWPKEALTLNHNPHRKISDSDSIIV